MLSLYNSKQNADFVRKLLCDGIKNGIKIKLVLVDREFFTVGVISTIKQLHLKFLMPAKKTPGIKKAINEYIVGERKSNSQYVMRSVAEH